MDNKSIQIENKTYLYDYIANINSTQEEIFQHCAKRICDNSLNGYNGTIFHMAKLDLEKLSLY